MGVSPLASKLAVNDLATILFCVILEVDVAAGVK
jgi:hypothetical protein